MRWEALCRLSVPGCEHLCVCTHVHMPRLCVRAGMCICICLCVCELSVNVCMWVHVCAQVCLCVHMCVCVYMHALARVHGVCAWVCMCLHVCMLCACAWGACVYVHVCWGGPTHHVLQAPCGCQPLLVCLALLPCLPWLPAFPSPVLSLLGVIPFINSAWPWFPWCSDKNWNSSHNCREWGSWERERRREGTFSVQEAQVSVAVAGFSSFRGI